MTSAPVLPTPTLPGMEDVDAPPEVQGWDYALWRVRNAPAKRALVEALKRLARGAASCFPSNETILAAVVSIRPMKLRALTVTLRALDVEDRLIDRTPEPHAKSRRRIRFRFLTAETPVRQSSGGRKEPAPMGAGSLRPWAQGTCAPAAAQEASPVWVPSPPEPPLNSLRKERTLTLRAGGEDRGPEGPTDGQVATWEAEARLPGHRGVTARFRLLALRAAEEEAQADAKAQAGVSPEPPAPTPRVTSWTPPAAIQASAPVETEALLRRLPTTAPGPDRDAVVELAARRLADRLGDQGWLPYHRRRCRQVADGEIGVKVLVGAWKASRSPTAQNPGAIFAAFLKNQEGPPASEKKPADGPSGNCPADRPRKLPRTSSHYSVNGSARQ